MSVTIISLSQLSRKDTRIQLFKCAHLFYFSGLYYCRFSTSGFRADGRTKTFEDISLGIFLKTIFWCSIDSIINQIFKKIIIIKE